MKGKEGEHSDQSNEAVIAKATRPDNQRVIRTLMRVSWCGRIVYVLSIMF